MKRLILAGLAALMLGPCAWAQPPKPAYVTGAPTTGAIAKASGPQSFTTGDLSGDCSTTATLATVCLKTNGVTFGSFATGTDAANLTGTLGCGRFPALTGDVTTSAGSCAAAIGVNKVALADVAQIGANTVLGNWTGSTANVAAQSLTSCPDSAGNHLNYVSGTGITCGTSDAHAGTVTSVGLSLPSFITVTGSPVTGASTLTGTLATQSANTIFAGPATGAAAAPTFRAPVAADLPNNAANPTAIASDVAVNGTATTWMRSDAAPPVQKGTSSVFGLMKCDGSTITCPGGVVTAAGSVVIQSVSPGGGTVASFTSIPGTSHGLRIIGFGRSSGAGTGTDQVKMTFNSDTGSHYTHQFIISNASAGSPVQFQATGNPFIQAGELPKAGDVASYPGSFVVEIPNYADTTFFKTETGQYITFNSTTTASIYNIPVVGSWADTSAITRIDLTVSGGWATGSKVILEAY